MHTCVSPISGVPLRMEDSSNGARHPPDVAKEATGLWGVVDANHTFRLRTKLSHPSNLQYFPLPGTHLF